MEILAFALRRLMDSHCFVDLFRLSFDDNFVGVVSSRVIEVVGRHCLLIR